MSNCFYPVRTALTVLSLSLLPASSLYALTVDGIPEPWSVRLQGFGTAAVTMTDSGSLGFRRELTQDDGVTADSPSLLNDSLLAVQTNIDWHSKVEAAVQLLAQDRAEGSFDDALHFLFLGWRVTPRINLRAGRLPLDVYMLSESRNTGYSNLWVRPITEFYGQMELDNFTGGDMSCHYPLGRGDVTFRLGVGEFDTSVASAGMRTTNVTIRSFWNTNLQYQDENWRVRLGYVQGIFDHIDGGYDFSSLASDMRDPSMAPLLTDSDFVQYVDQLDLPGSRLRYYSFGFTWENVDWTVLGELGLLQYEKMFSLKNKSAYLSVGRHLGDVTPYVAAARLYSSYDSPGEGVQQVFAANPQLAFLDSYFHTGLYDETAVSLGVRWDFRTDMALKAQWDHHWVEEDGATLWLQEGSGSDSNINVFTLALDFIF